MRQWILAMVLAAVVAAPWLPPGCRYVVSPCSSRYPAGWGSARTCQRYVLVCRGATWPRAQAR